MEEARWWCVEDAEAEALEVELELEPEVLLLGRGDWRTLVKTVLSAARNVPRRVRRRPQVVK